MLVNVVKALLWWKKTGEILLFVRILFCTFASCFAKTRTKYRLDYEEDFDLLAGYVRADNCLWTAEF